MKTTEIRNKVKAYMEVGFTMSEAFKNIRDYAKRINVNPNSYRELSGRMREEGKLENYDAKKYLH